MLTADPLTDGATGLVFPGSPGHWLRVGYRELEPKDTQGVTYTYQMEGEGQGVLTCYVYTLGLNGIPDGADSDHARLEMWNVCQGVVQTWSEAQGQVTEILPIRALRTMDGNRLLAYIGAHSIKQTFADSISLTVLSAYKGSFLKIRSTFPGRDLQVAIDRLTDFVSLLFTANGSAMPGLTVSKEEVVIPGMRNVQVVYDNSMMPGTESGTVWLTYAMLRLRYRQDNKFLLPEHGEVVPSYAEELYGRMGAMHAYVQLKYNTPGWKATYWEKIRDVDAAGFLAPYVWTYHHRPDWPASDQPDKLSEFRKWQKKKLKKHEPETHVKLLVEEPKPPVPPPPAREQPFVK